MQNCYTFQEKKTKISKLLEGGRASPWFPKMRPEPRDPPLETPLHRYTGLLSYDFVSNSLHVPRSPNYSPFYTLHSPFGIGDALFLTVPTPTSAPLADPGGGQHGHGPLKLRKGSHHVFWPQNLQKKLFSKVNFGPSQKQWVKSEEFLVLGVP